MPESSPLVIDASVAIAECIPEQHSVPARAILIRVAREGAMVPVLWPLEVGNVLLIAERRGRIDRQERFGFLDRLGRLPIALDMDSSARAWAETMALAEQHQLTLYDATYLELAVRKSATLASFDAALRRAAPAAGIALA